jgi:hypothetical protein
MLAQTPQEVNPRVPYLVGMENSHVVSALKERRSALAGQIVDTRRQLEQQLGQLQADLFHIDAVLKQYGVDPDDIPAKGRMPVRSTYFGRKEMSTRCRDMLRERGTVKADDVAVRAMLDKGLDPETDRKQRHDFVRRVLVTLHDLRKANQVEKVGHGRGVVWRAIPGE